MVAKARVRAQISAGRQSPRGSIEHQAGLDIAKAILLLPAVVAYRLAKIVAERKIAHLRPQPEVGDRSVSNMTDKPTLGPMPRKSWVRPTTSELATWPGKLVVPTTERPTRWANTKGATNKIAIKSRRKFSWVEDLFKE